MVTGTGLSIFATILTIAALIKDGGLEKIGLGLSPEQLVAAHPCELDPPVVLGSSKKVMFCKGKKMRQVSFLFLDDKLARIDVALKNGLEAAAAAKALDAKHPVDALKGTLTSVGGFACRVDAKEKDEEACRRTWKSGSYEIRASSGRISLRHQIPQIGKVIQEL